MTATARLTLTADLRHRDATYDPLHLGAQRKIVSERIQRLLASVLIDPFRIAVLKRDERDFLPEQHLGRDSLLAICGINPVRFQQRKVPRLAILFRTIDEIRRRDSLGDELRKRFKIPKNPAIGFLTSAAATLLREREVDSGNSVSTL